MHLTRFTTSRRNPGAALTRAAVASCGVAAVCGHLLAVLVVAGWPAWPRWPGSGKRRDRSSAADIGPAISVNIMTHIA